MFIGQYNNKMDSKGRISVPVKFREELGIKFIVTRGLDSCLFGYSLEEWEKAETCRFLRPDFGSIGSLLLYALG